MCTCSLKTPHGLTKKKKDKLIWKGDASCYFTVTGYFNQLEGDSPCSVPTKMLWNPYVPSKLFFFCQGGLVGQGPNFNSAKEKRFSVS